MRWPAILLVLATAACDQCAPKPRGAPRDAGGTQTATRAADLPIEERLPQMRYKAPVVYLDGAPLGVVTFGELPPGLKTSWTALADGRKVRRFVLADYLREVGVPIEKVVEVHLYGGRTRVAILKGDMLRRFEKKLLFSFTQSDQGKPRLHWPGEGFEVSDAIDKFVTVAVYVDRKPPVQAENGDLILDGEVVEGVPYVDIELRGGTRVYVDGKFAAFIKRNRIDTRTLVAGSPEAGEARYALKGQLASQGVSLEEMKTADLVYEDKLVERLPAAALLDQQIALVDRSGGTITLQPKGVQVTAILLYARKLPTDLETR